MDKYLLDCLDKVLAGIFSPAGWSGGAERELAELTDHGCALHELESGTPFIQCEIQMYPSLSSAIIPVANSNPFT